MVSGQRRRDNHGGAAEPNRRTFGVEVDQRRQPYVDGLPPSKENGP